MGCQRNAIALQRRLQAEAQRVAYKGCQDRDLAWRHSFLAHEVVDLPAGPLDHLRVEAEQLIRCHERSPGLGDAGRGRRCAVHLQQPIDAVIQVFNGGRHDKRVVEPLLHRTGVGQRIHALRIGAEKGAIAAVVVGNDQRALQHRQPLLDQPMRAERVLFGVVVDQVAMGAQQVRAAPLVGEHLFVEERHLQAEIENGAFEAVAAKRDADRPRRAQGVEARRALLAQRHGQLEPRIRRVDRQALQRRLVEVVQHLADDAAALDAHAIKRALADRVVDEGRHVVLASFQREEGRLLRGRAETGLARNERPVEFDCLLGEAGEGGDAHRGAARHVAATQRFVVGRGEGTLWHQHENVVATHAFLAQQVPEMVDGSRGLARAKRAGKKAFALSRAGFHDSDAASPCAVPARGLFGLGAGIVYPTVPQRMLP